ncbi:cation transporter [Lucifera butyrica]|uniref:Cation transporter n=1 Tax=Lucifera butyrica TaxID=1351585 RepID=A0A498R485_9FIRM|nr:TrkH family potassium uptake protein [Lucifera butyrica]VBB05082.1 cation transporter [Lucifera butyrica]
MDVFNRWYRLLNPLHWRLTTYQMLALSFAALIVFGALLLMTPFASVRSSSLSFIDALFTATSAVCVTGLVVTDTGTYFSFFGQTVILLLIEIGGLGIMTVATLLVVITGKRINLRERLLIQEATNQLDLSGVVRLTLYIVKATVLVEFIGGSILAAHFYQDLGWQGIYFGYWHAVSAFCNAGFDLFGQFRSITGYVNDFVVNATIGGLIIIGGIGFPVIADLWNYPVRKHFSLHSKVVIATSLGLIVTGAVFIFAAEYTNNSTLGELTLSGKILASFFQSVTARTAGYNTIDTGSLREGTLLMLIVLMFIGASPSSMGGGIKTSTFAVLTSAIISSVTGKKDPVIFLRKVSQLTVYKAFTVVMISLMLVTGVSLVMTFTEQVPFIRILFEVVSAFGTVGLSTGITPTLSETGKALIILTMFSGRVGTITLLMALALRPHKAAIKYPEGKFIIG